MKFFDIFQALAIVMKVFEKGFCLQGRDGVMSLQVDNTLLNCPKILPHDCFD